MTSHAGKLVMFVEDDEDIARLVAHHLKLAGFQVRRPAQPSNLIFEAEREHPVLFILDLMLPGMDGFQLCSAVKAHPSLRKIPVLILTARTSAEDRKRALESGADLYMTKPFKPSVLLEAVRKMANSSGTK